MSALVFVVEDDRAARDALSRALRLEGYDVQSFVDATSALEAMASARPDVMVLDWMLPGLDGLSACRRLRRQGDRTPILMLTARTDTADRVSALDAGADDYVPKPYELEELLARLRALLRRTEQRSSSVARLDDLVVDEAARTAARGGVELELTRIEFDLLAVLVRNAGRVMSHAQLYDQIWGYDFGPHSKNLAVYIGYLRRKTEEHGGGRLIHTVRGVGYVARATP